MNRLKIRHYSRFTYAAPVTLGRHRLMLRPRDSHVSRLLDARLTISPHAELRWEYDVFGNSVAIASFERPTTELVIDSSIVIDHYGMTADHPALDDSAMTVPLVYSAAEAPDLLPFVARYYPDPERAIEAWARGFLGPGGATGTLTMLQAMTAEISRSFSYVMRFEAGTQAPAQTLWTRSGTCRDFALFMIEALRCLGLAARFVTGYLHGGRPGQDATRSTSIAWPHAWLEVYLPGAGWIEFDPTNGLAGSDRLIRVAVSRDPDQAMPIKGSYSGTPGACIDTQVRVEIFPLPMTDLPMLDTFSASLGSAA